MQTFHKIFLHRQSQWCSVKLEKKSFIDLFLLSARLHTSKIQNSLVIFRGVYTMYHMLHCYKYGRKWKCGKKSTSHEIDCVHDFPHEMKKAIEITTIIHHKLPDVLITIRIGWKLHFQLLKFNARFCFVFGILANSESCSQKREHCEDLKLRILSAQHVQIQRERRMCPLWDSIKLFKKS